MKNWKTTIAAIALGTAEALQALPNYSSMSSTDLLMHAAKIFFIVALGALARDATPTPPTPPSAP